MFRCGELRWVGHPERRLQEAAKHGLRDVIAPLESGSSGEVATLREALSLALPGGPSVRRMRVGSQPASAHSPG